LSPITVFRCSVVYLKTHPPSLFALFSIADVLTYSPRSVVVNGVMKDPLDTCPFTPLYTSPARRSVAHSTTPRHPYDVNIGAGDPGSTVCLFCPASRKRSDAFMRYRRLRCFNLLSSFPFLDFGIRNWELLCLALIIMSLWTLKRRPICTSLGEPIRRPFFPGTTPFLLLMRNLIAMTISRITRVISPTRQSDLPRRIDRVIRLASFLLCLLLMMEVSLMIEVLVCV
jgi:hypothetical protein